MMLKNAIKYGILCWVVIGLMIYGCASFGKFTPTGAIIANNAVTLAQGLLHGLEGFYGDLLGLKMVSDYTTEATRALSMADAAAATLRAIIAGATVTDEQLNLVAGQVDGAKATLTNIQVKK